MTVSSSKRLVSNQMILNIVGALMMAWAGVLAWPMLWPLTWVSVLVLPCLIYIVGRMMFELTINRAVIPTLAMSFAARRQIADVLRREATAHGQEAYAIVDLGSGRGQLARHLAKKIPSAHVTGVEFARIPYLQARWVQRWFGPKNLAFTCGDFWQFDASGFDAVVMYLGPLTVQRLGEKLSQELKPGSTVLSHTFPLGGAWEPADILTFRSPFKEMVYVYRR